MKCAFRLVVYLAVLSCTVDATLRQIHVLFRHGERTPTALYPNDPHKNYEWPNGLGHLTQRGKLQIYKLAEKIRANYSDFLPKHYSPKTVKLYSSYADRCLMSAELFAAGLFPPNGPEIWNEHLLWQPIPVHYKPRSQDNFIAAKQKCPKYDQIYEDNKVNLPKIIDINAEFYDLFKFVSKHTGMLVNDIGTIETLYNTLEIQESHNLSLPYWVNRTVMIKMKQIGAQNLALYTETDYMKKIKGGVLLKRILDSMQRVADNIDEPIINLYSGHDITIVHLLRTLDLVNVFKPDFGSTVIVELHVNSNGYTDIKLLYAQSWDSPMQLYELGGLTSVLNKYEHVLPENWDAECAAE